MSQAVFPDAEKLFSQAVASNDPLTSIQGLLTQHPNWQAMTELVVAYTEAVEENPAQGPRLASVLAQLGEFQPFPDGPVTSFRDLLNRELADQHFKWGGCLEGPYTWGPQNRHLLESYLSGLSLKYQLTASSDMYAAADRGLDTTPDTPYAQELVIGTCIQLLLAGHSFISDEAGSYKKTPQEISAKLKNQENSGIIFNADALRFLKLTIQHAENGFEEATDGNVFAILFPSN
ncbi:hypothetical protein BKA70DRAFT_1438128 [Coprinopsis sp. MPI-PUGE-AT-0042]|nr:hypothetical protein BKA70DRAFT_1438128 [Coprinopsis sp. MPI-PUGE-AT-0042]